MRGQNVDRAALLNLALELELSLFGVADIREIRQEFLLSPETRDKYPYAISLGKRLVRDVLEDIQDRPTQLYFHHYRQVNNFLDRAALQMASAIQEQGHRALPIAASQIIDWEKQKAHVGHKKIGLLAGLGWIGRNNLLVNPEFGAQFRLVTILTDMPLEPDSPLQDDCGSCRKCLAVCPAQAIKESPGRFDHVACYQKLQEFRRAGYVSQFICGICVKACDGTGRRRKD